MSIEQRARFFAMGAHREQKYGDRPYVFHLDAVRAVLAEHGVREDGELAVASYLHDVMEDCGIGYDTLAVLFSDRVASLVELVTDKPGKNRSERHEKTYPLIAQNRLATILKLADRIANVRQCISSQNEGLSKMYLKEYPRFRELLWRNDAPQVIYRYWHQLDALMEDLLK